MNYKMLLICAGLLLVGCSKRDFQEVEKKEYSSESRMVYVEAHTPQNAQMLTTFTEKPVDPTKGHGFNVEWKEGDKFSIICWQGDDSHWGDAIRNNYEIKHTLKADEIKDGNKSIAIKFEIPKEIQKTEEPIQVLITYLGNSHYEICNKTEDRFSAFKDKPWLKIAPMEVVGDENLDYVAQAMPMTLRGTIAAGWKSGTKFTYNSGNNFNYLATLLAVDLKSTTTEVVDPKCISVIYEDGEVMKAGDYAYWDPINPQVPTKISGENKSQVNISNGYLYPGKMERTFYVTGYFVNAPTKIKVQLESRTDSNPHETSVKENTTLQMKPGKCYTLKTVVDNDGAQESIKWQ